MFDLTPFTKVEVHGPGALAFLQELAANDVDRPAGTIVYTAMCAPRGGIMCDLTITRLDEQRFLVVTGGAVGRHDIAWMSRHLPWDGSVVLEDKTSALCCIGLWGPRARDVLAALCEDDVSNEAFPYMAAREIHVGPVPVRALRISYVGELGWELYAPVEFGLTLWELLWEAGAGHGVVACGGAAYDSLRLEKGYRLWGQDIDEEHDPYEAGLGWAVRLEKGAVHRPRRARGGQARRRAPAALPRRRRPERRARRQGADPRRRPGDRLRHQRRARRLGRPEHPLRLPAGGARRDRHRARGPTSRASATA